MTFAASEVDLSGRTVLVTGGAGFIGSHLASALVAGNTVRVLDDLSTGRRENVPDEAELLVGDVRNDATRSAAMDGVDLVFHEAAQVSVARSIEQPLATNRINADATVALLEDARRMDARVVVASSAAVYGQPHSLPITEDSPMTPTSPYGASKVTADHYVRIYADRYGLPTVALRYFNAYGPGQPGGDYSGVISTFREQALTDEPITVEGDGDQTRDFVHVRDVVRANLRAATTDHVGRAYNVATGETVTIDRLARAIKDVLDSQSPVRYVEAREGDIRHSRADTTAARRDLGFEASVDLPDGLRTLRGVPAAGD
ncbi:MAG: NAD-dependent epimerase/dehydratase family protein [Halorhabdus sp.]